VKTRLNGSLVAVSATEGLFAFEPDARSAKGGVPTSQLVPVASGTQHPK
jgi:hypothetical protein